MRERSLSGLEAVEMATRLLQRRRSIHPTYGSYEAAELQWWWSQPRSTDDLAQLFWVDDDDLPSAAFLLNDFSDGSSALYTTATACVFVLPDSPPALLERAVERGLEVAAGAGFATVEFEVGQDDTTLRNVLTGRGFDIAETDVIAEAWLAADERPGVTALADGYRLVTRRDVRDRPHHMTERNPRFSEDRIRQTSLYRDDLDLVVLAPDDGTAGYGMFWLDPVTSTGVVEPMRTRDEHQQRGIARHILTTGVERLVEAGATRISIGWEPDNPASGDLYRSVGFEATATNDLFNGPTA